MRGDVASSSMMGINRQNDREAHVPIDTKLWVVQTRNVAPRDEVRLHVKEHLAHQVALEKSGVLFGAGPLTDEQGQPGGMGLIIIRAPDVATARQIAESDPMHRAGVRTFTLHQWSMNEGHLTISFDVSDRRLLIE